MEQSSYKSIFGNFIVIIDYCSNFIELESISQIRHTPCTLNHRNTTTLPINSTTDWMMYKNTTATITYTKTPQQIPAKLKNGQHKQAEYYNRMAKSLKSLNIGDSVRIKLPGSNIWSCGICRKQVAKRSEQRQCLPL